MQAFLKSTCLLLPWLQHSSKAHESFLLYSDQVFLMHGITPILIENPESQPHAIGTGKIPILTSVLIFFSKTVITLTLLEHEFITLRSDILIKENDKKLYKSEYCTSNVSVTVKVCRRVYTAQFLWLGSRFHFLVRRTQGTYQNVSPDFSYSDSLTVSRRNNTASYCIDK